jgi:ubiquinone/menaquinone biosynthesis C-methylase UbiE
MLCPTLSKFPWPKPSGTIERPSWNGENFALDGATAEILCFGDASSAWSDDLTRLHEAEANSTHPIDIASRNLAIESLRPLADFPDPVIIDIGCSSGYLLQEIQQKLPHVALIGSDYIPTIVRNAARRSPGIPFVQFDLRCCPLPDSCVDGVTALNVLEHIDDDFQAIREVFRILKPRGIAHFEVPASPRCFDLYDEVLMHHRRYRLTEFAKSCTAAGFVVRKATHLGFLVFPAFAAVKMRNQRRYSHLPLDEKKILVAKQIRRTARLALLGQIFQIELKLGNLMAFPFGIRGVVQCVKPF